MDFLKLVKDRYSCRAYESRSVEKEKLDYVMECVRMAPSAVNKQPWRVVVCGDKAHFYEKRSKGYVAENGWDLQKIDLGIALCHFDCAAAENGLTVTFGLEDPKLASAGGMVYIASYTLS